MSASSSSSSPHSPSSSPRSPSSSPLSPSSSSTSSFSSSVKPSSHLWWPGSSPDPEQDPPSLSSFHLPPAVDTVSWYPPALCASSTRNAIYGRDILSVHGGHTGIKEIDGRAAFIVDMFQEMVRLRLSVKEAEYLATLVPSSAEEMKEFTKAFWDYHDIYLHAVQRVREEFESDFLIPAPPVPPSLFHHF